MKCFLDINNFLEKISSLSHSIVFLNFFALFIQEGILIYSCYSLKLCIQLGISFPFIPCFPLLSSAICKGAISLLAEGGNGKPLQYSCSKTPWTQTVWKAEKPKYKSNKYIQDLYEKNYKTDEWKQRTKYNWPLSNAGASPCITYSWSSVSTVAPHPQIQPNMDCV